MTREREHLLIVWLHTEMERHELESAIANPDIGIIDAIQDCVEVYDWMLPDNTVTVSPAQGDNGELIWDWVKGVPV